MLNDSVHLFDYIEWEIDDKTTVATFRRNTVTDGIIECGSTDATGKLTIWYFNLLDNSVDGRDGTWHEYTDVRVINPTDYFTDYRIKLLKHLISMVNQNIDNLQMTEDRYAEVLANLIKKVI